MVRLFSPNGAVYGQAHALASLSLALALASISLALALASISLALASISFALASVANRAYKLKKFYGGIG